jgi:ribosomal protein S18 acetylase RimI-like enzyme
MKVSFLRIQSVVQGNFFRLLPLYEEAFPREERRDPEALATMLNGPLMHFSAVIGQRQLVGLVVFWRFDRFLYIEHLAVFPHLRCKGIGEAILKKLCKESKPILLEVEIPYDQLSLSRVDFYQKCGFFSLPIAYQQPPYRSGETVIPMRLFSNQTDWLPETLKESVQLFHEKVYGVKAFEI